MERMKKHPIDPTPGMTYTNHNGYTYRCIAHQGWSSARMERLSDGWTLDAHGIQRYEDGSIEWDGSTGGHWPKEV